MANRVTRTYVASIRNHRQVRNDLDLLGFAASKLWNIARWTCDRIWHETGTIPDHGVLKAYLKSHERYADLNAQSSQAILEELAEAFDSWYALRGNGDENANPPGYRKHGDDHPRSTVTFKEDGFKHDSDHNRIRLSKGRNLKDGRRDFILCEYAADPDVTVQNVQQVRAVWTGTEWELHIVCNVEVDNPDPPGDRVAGIDLGICNFAAVAVGDDALLYPGGALKEDEYYFQKERAKCDDSSSRRAHRLDRKRDERRTHFFHAVSKDIVTECAARNVGTIAVGDLTGIREGADWGDHGNLDLHGWAFDRFTEMLEYKAAERGISVERVDERETSKSCGSCGTTDDSQRVERGLYVCEACGLVANADVNGAENIRQKVLPTLACDGGDRDTGWMAQPAVRLFDKSTGRVAPQEQVTREP
ncbi:RNA-guided endonuclease InsQ/TnpB family protein [Halosimplex halophilum]|uniref:RNA-guided endonuclease InsQ/TnpB family protein n=1 Tax=Halosimplex halophilum TaxID=2559572 RepID=UPI00107FB684|nr:RNA-guided endonuclease TnpB family protein [Halosimplex halophilum]